MNNLYDNTPRFIFTASPGDEQIALNEIHALNPRARLKERLAAGVGLVEAEAGFNYAAFVKLMADNLPVFIRHISPVQASAEYPALDENIVLLKDRLDIQCSFSVQTRVFDDRGEHIGHDINNHISDMLVGMGYTLDVKAPAQIVSIAILGGAAHIGVSLARDNLSAWPGGRVRFMRDESRLSRAEFKLMEAVQVFGLKFNDNGLALDLGAAPGGWTSVLRQNGQLVTAVDPASLHATLAADKGVRHIKTTAGQYLKALKNERFDVITNDMKMDAGLSIDIMAAARPFLKDTGFCVLTLKLGERNMQKNTAKALAVLRKYYGSVLARRLFHNRSEVTAVMQP